MVLKGPLVNRTKPLILHIDDSEANRYAVKRILEKSGYDVMEADTGEEGLKLVKEVLPDLVVLDIKLPDIDGYEVCRRIKGDPEIKFIPVLQSSASFISSQDKVEGLDSGADGYLAQPIESAVLVATVKSLLRITEAEKLAKEASRSREDVLAVVSHDLRTPLTFVMLQAKVMEKELAKGSISNTELINRMKRINNSCLKMNRLIQDLLDVTTLERDKLNLDRKKFPVHEIISDTMAFHEELAREAGITLTKSLNGLEELLIDADKERLQQVLGNLVTNSIKFTQSGGEISISLNRDQDFLNFVVADNGKGIPSDHLKNVFNRYWKGHDVRKSGYGLGLSIVKGITEAHGGNVKIQSKEGEGTVVQFSIPVS